MEHSATIASAAPSVREPGEGTGVVRDFLDQHFLHFNSRELTAAARAYAAHVEAGGKMMITLAGAMSTAGIGRTLSRMIRQDKVHAICCTGANLEEDLFNLLAYDEYRTIDNWRALSAADEKNLFDSGYNRVTDTCIPETVMRHLERRLLEVWREACEGGERRFPHQFLRQVLRDPSLHEHFCIPPEHSWMISAMEKDVPVYTPGWEDSTTGNMFAAAVFRGDVPHHQCVKTGTEQMEHLMRWYLDQHGLPQQKPPPHDRASASGSAGAAQPPRGDVQGVGFFQIGGGIAGDFPICAVPVLIQDLQREDVRFWSYFCQIGDAPASYGGYSGAVPNEKITWGKLDVDTPKFMIQSDATIVAPLVFAHVLGD